MSGQIQKKRPGGEGEGGQNDSEYQDQTSLIPDNSEIDKLLEDARKAGRTSITRAKKEEKEKIPLPKGGVCKCW